MSTLVARSVRRLAAARARRAVRREHRLIVASGRFDVAWYAGEAGREFTGLDEAVAHYRAVGAALDLSPHPLFEPTSIGPPSEGWTPFGSYLWSKRFRGVAPHPAVAATELAATPEASTALEVVLPGSLRSVHWGAVAGGWREVVVARSARRRVNVPGGVRTLPADHHVEIPPTPEATDATLVSIVMPTWNRPDHTVTAIKSVQAQTWPHWELLLVDDGSTDDTVARVRAIADLDPRVRLIERPHEGVCAARNTALDAARGGYVAFLDSDNTWLAHFLHDMVAVMADRDLPAAYGTLQADGPTGRLWRVAPTSPELIRVKNQIDMNVLVVRSDVMQQVGGFDPTLRRAVDWDLAVRIVDDAPVTHLPIVGVLYDHDADRADRISTSEADMWPHVVRQRYNVDWDAERTRERDPDLLSVVVMLGKDVATTAAQLESVLVAFSGRPREIVLVDCDAPRHAVTRLAAWLALDPTARVVGYPRPMSWAFAADLGVAASRGHAVVVVDHGVRVDAIGLQALVAALEAGDLAVPATDPDRAQAFAIRSDAFFAVGGLDAMMHQTHEVADLSRRLAAVDRTTVAVPSALVDVVTPKTSVYEAQVVAEFERRHG